MHNKNSLSIEELKNYRDMLIGNLEDQILLLNDISSDLLKEEENTDKELTQKRVTEYTELLSGEIHKLKNFDVVLAVIGTMKSGKSTTINAIVGREIMPHRDAAMTVLPTLICHTPGKKEPVVTFNNPAIDDFVARIKQVIIANPDLEKRKKISGHKYFPTLVEQIKQGYQFSKPAHGDKAVFEFLDYLNDLPRLSETLKAILEEEHKNTEYGDISFPYNECCNITQLPRIEVEFSHLTNRASSEGRLILLDTAGPNEAKLPRLKIMLEEQLKRSSAVLLVLDSMQIGSEAEDKLREELEKIGTIEESRLFVLANQFDRKDSRSANEEETKEKICNDLLKDKVERKNIFPVSAKNAYLAYRMKAKLAKHYERPDLNEEPWIKDFAKVAFGHNGDEWPDYLTLEIINDKVTQLIEGSKMEQVIDKVIAKTQTEAPIIAMRSAIAQITNNVAKTVQNFINIHSTVSKATEAELKQIEETLKQLDLKIESVKQMETEAVDSVKKLKEEVEREKEDTIKSVRTTVNAQINELWGNTQTWIKATGTRTTRFLGLSRITRETKDIMRWYEHGDEFIFPDIASRDQFCEKLNKFYQEVTDLVCKGAEEVISYLKQKVSDELEGIEEKCKAQSEEIKERFKTNKIEVELIMPSLREFSRSTITKFSYSKDTIMSYNQTVKKEQEGVSGSIKRGFGALFGFFGADCDDWGYDEETKIYYKVSKKHLEYRMQSDLEKNVIEKIHSEIKNVLGEFDEEFTRDYIGMVQNLIQRLSNELRSANKNATDNKNEKEQYQQEIEGLRRRSNSITDNIALICENLGIDIGIKPGVNNV